jgi:hypothetical protein
MHVASFERDGEILFQGGIVFSRTLGTDRVLREQLVACASGLVRDQESRDRSSAILLRGMGTSSLAPVVLLQSTDEIALRGFLLKWNQLSAALVGCCAVMGDPAEYQSWIARFEGAALEIENAPESQEETSFYPAYRLLERAAHVSKRMSERGAAAVACWRIDAISAGSFERQLRLNLVRLQRSWVPPRIRAEQELLAQNFVAGSLTAHQFVIVPEPSHVSIVRSILHEDSAAMLEPSGFSCSVVREHDRLSASLLPKAPVDLASPGDAVASGFLLNGLTAHIVASREPVAPAPPKSPRKVFLSYSHRDKEFASQLAIGCAQLRRDGWIQLWSDAEILAGAPWREEIYTALEQADLVLLLISPDFIQSDFCYGIEMTRALERHREGRARVVPIVIRATDTAGAPFAQFQMLPTGGAPITSWPDRDSAWLDVARGLRRFLESLPRSER